MFVCNPDPRLVCWPPDARCRSEQTSRLLVRAAASAFFALDLVPLLYMSAYTSKCSNAPSCLLSRHAQPNFITIDQILDDKNPGFAQLENCAEIGACVCV